jgi:hypothetical protein
MNTAKLLAQFVLTSMVVLAGTVALAGCGGTSESPAEPAAAPSPSLPAAVAGTVEQVAAKLGCTPEIRTEADELREGACATPDAEFKITTFPREDLKLTWLDAAAGWGGWYVVGPRWAVGVGTKPLALAFQKKIGGSIVDGSKIPKPEGPVAQ